MTGLQKCILGIGSGTILGLIVYPLLWITDGNAYALFLYGIFGGVFATKYNDYLHKQDKEQQR